MDRHERGTGLSWALLLSVLSVFAFGNCLGAIDGALSKIADALEVDHTIALYVGSIPALTSVASSLVLGAVAGKRLPYKPCAVASAALMVISGVMPCLAGDFVTILVARCFFGLGLGGMMSLQNPIATKLIPLQDRARVLGIGTSVAYLCQCILQFVGGILADVSWNLVFLTHILLVIPLVGFIVLLPSIEVEPPVAESKGSGRIPPVAVAMCLVIGIAMMILAPLLFGSAFYVAAIMDSATVAAVVAMLFSVGSMVGGACYPVLQRRFKRASFSAFLLIGAVGLVFAAHATTIPVLGAGFFIGGFSFASMQAGVMYLLGTVCPPERVGFASALMVTFMNLGGFFCSSWETAVGAVSGDSLYAPLVVGAVVFAVLAVVLFAASPVAGERAEKRG